MEKRVNTRSAVGGTHIVQCYLHLIVVFVIVIVNNSNEPCQDIGIPEELLWYFYL